MKQEIPRVDGSVLATVEIDCPDSCLYVTKLGLAAVEAVKSDISLEGADLQGADLRGSKLYLADLRGANLHRACLQGANLYSACLQRADLRMADLRGAYMQEVDLRGADMRLANLQGAYLHGSDLHGADLRGAGLTVLHLDDTTVYIQPEYILIGREYHTVDKWFSFTDEEIYKKRIDALTWWKVWKPTIQAIHATLTHTIRRK